MCLYRVVAVAAEARPRVLKHECRAAGWPGTGSLTKQVTLREEVVVAA